MSKINNERDILAGAMLKVMRILKFNFFATT